MKFTQFGFFIISILILFTSCSKSTQNKKNTSETKSNETKSSEVLKDTNTELSKYLLDNQNPQIIQLPSELLEISGITMTEDGRLFAQQDESGIVYQINPTDGSIIKKFSLNDPPVKDDFEDIVHANNKFYLVNSKGTIYEFSEGNDGSNVSFEKYETGFKSKNDIEGLCYDPETNSLLLALKGDPGTSETNVKAVYSFSLDKKQLSEQPRFLIPISDVKKSFSPSGIQKHPVSGTFFIISSTGNEIIEISKDGKVIGRHPLPSNIHGQPEGITFGKDNTLYISNEGKSGTGTIVVYPYKK